MKKPYHQITLLSLLLLLCACNNNSSEEEQKPGNNEATFVKEYVLDTETNLKNPYMGWSLYSEGGQQTDKPAMYWYLQNPAAQYAGTLYIRWRWSDLEPEEGQYAWDNNEDFKGMIQGAVDRGLRIAFRIYVNGRDNLKPATPQFVLDKAASYIVAPGHLTPYADDEFFLEKYTNFIAAFGAKFNDPTLVDYVDSYGLGFWGEEHNVKYQNSANANASHNRIVRAYAHAFDKVINVINYGARNTAQQAVVYDELGFSPRRDGYASTYFPVSQQTGIVAHFPSKIIIAEACYWKDTPISSYENGKWSSWAVYYKDVVSLALNTHANYLDLRTYTESSRYLDVAKDQVERFIEKGGYRIYPKIITCDYKDDKLNIEHTWLNHANGVLPNNNVSLGYKYKIAFALFDTNNKLVQKWISNQVEVSQLVNQEEITGNEDIDISAVPAGNYQLGVAIINTRENDSKDIKLAISNPNTITGEWVLVGEISNN
ncbi:MAG: hypothetical protein ACK5IJ_11400 [Mangrovibacterium sp.]